MELIYRNKYWKRITIRFQKDFADITKALLIGELKRNDVENPEKQILVQREEVTGKRFDQWKRDRKKFEYYGGDIHRKPRFQYDIFVRTDFAHIVKGKVR